VKATLSFFSLLLAIIPGVSAACQDLSAYRVDKLVFNQLSLHKAVAETLKGTPYRVAYSSELHSDALVTATGVSGPLDRVLRDLLGQFSLSYVQNGCEVRIIPNEKRILNLVPGDMLNEKLGEWLKLYGYDLFWDAPKYRMNGSLSIMKSVDGALNDVIAFMKANGVKLAVEIYDNHAVRVTEVK